MKKILTKIFVAIRRLNIAEWQHYCNNVFATVFNCLYENYLSVNEPEICKSQYIFSKSFKLLNNFL